MEASMLGNSLAFLSSIGDTLVATIPVTIVLAAVFTVLGHFWACNPGKPWWRRRELGTDVIYWFFVPWLARIVRISLLVYAAGLFFNIRTTEELAAFYDNGHGPLAALPLAAQAVFLLVVSDFMLYWIHRVFHGGSWWKYHAVHHAPEEVDWLSAARFHPVNLVLGPVAVDVCMLLAGVSPDVMVWLAPFTTFHSAFVHANLRWTLGPLKYVIATPVFHRWHHTSLNEGANTNYAATFPVWDLLFGTFRMPTGALPARYGADDPMMPASFQEQLVYPFKAR
jgi:sterol desaturase/sphingolipid hydroxylase (fatty acid hydroxylase superfamily)